jgi:RNase P subunit RPR2
MRPSENVKNNNAVKAPSNSKASSVIRLPVKKTYCPKCQKLVKGEAQNTNNLMQVVCPKCSLSLWSWKSTGWRSTRRDGVSL